MTQQGGKRKLPMQPLVRDHQQVIRFDANKVVRFLLDEATKAGIDLNYLAVNAPPDQDDWSQFAQLIGYSVSGYGDLDYAIPRIVRKADRLAEKLT